VKYHKFWDGRTFDSIDPFGNTLFGIGPKKPSERPERACAMAAGRTRMQNALAGEE